MAPPESRKPTALVVDDDRTVRHLMTDALALFGFECRESASGANAIDALTAFEPDICIVDVAMPEMSGLELARRVRRHWPGMLLVAVTGSHHLYDEDEIAAVGFCRVFRKPFDIYSFVQFCQGLCTE
jgi:CheY-like chemotaxis protein